MTKKLVERCPSCGSPYFRPLDCDHVCHYAHCCECGTAWDPLPGEPVPKNMQACAQNFRQRAPFSEDERLEFAKAFERFFVRLGMDVHQPGTMDTPLRFVDAMIDATGGYDGDPKIRVLFNNECPSECGQDQIVESPITFFSICEHHVLPIKGRAYIGYIPNRMVMGLSKLTRIVRVMAKRFTSQERMGYQIVEVLEKIAAPKGVGLMLVAEHFCTQMRGVHEVGATTTTLVWKGVYETDEELRRSLLHLVRGA